MKLITYERLAEYGIVYSKEHLRRLEAAGKFPRRVKLTPGDRQSSYGWAENEIEDHVRKLIAARDAETEAA